MKSSISEAQKAWEHSCWRGDMKWLEDTTFVSADCFQPPTTAPLRPWKRISVPSAIVRHGDLKIHKRVVANPYVDTKYNAVVAELDSQGFGGRKRARTEKYLAAWSWGPARFDSAYKDQKIARFDLDRARLQVKRAYKKIMEDNQDIIAKQPASKRSTFPPAQLTWVPRKRHNTRWPVAPPEADAPLLAECQPLIKFEVHPGQINEPAFWEQHNPMELLEPGSEPVQLDAQQVHKLSTRRLSIVKRPSLSTIAEEPKEPSEFPVLTPGESRRSFYSSPLKRRSVATDRYNTPTMVASSPLKNFTITATPSKITIHDPIAIEETNEAEAVQLSPTKSTTETNEEPTAVETDNHGSQFRCPSSPLSSRSTATPASNKKPSPVKINHQGHCPSTPLSSQTATTAPSVAVFDQPTPAALTEPEYETRRRVSLDNARRSDRQSDAKVFKRVRNWVANTFAMKRRHSISTTIQEKPLQNRRHTLDVDVGRNLDIFGQTIQDTHDEVPGAQQVIATKETREMDMNANPEETARIETVQGETKEDIPQTEDLIATSREETAQQGVRRFTHIDWDLIKPINERYNRCPTTGFFSMSNRQSPTVDASETDRMTGPTTETPTSHTPIVEAPTADVPTVDHPMADAPAADANDDSELALLHNFVRRAQMKPKRRSSTTFSTGSPMAKVEIASAAIKSPRMPLGEKDANSSPSPSKKRKLKETEDASLTAAMRHSRLVKPDLEDTMPQPQRKKRRKGAEIDSPDDILNPDIDFSQNLTQKASVGGLRRSKRVATTKPIEPAAPSQIPVRLPGVSGMMLDADMPAVSTVGLMQRKTEKDLATLTRTNTRRNKGGAVPVQARLAGMSGLADVTNSDLFCSPAKPIITLRSGKAVRWDDTLVRTQGEDGGVANAPEDGDQAEDKNDAEELQPPQMRTELGRPNSPVGEHLLRHEEKLAAAPSPSPAKHEPAPEKKKKALRPRASRLPAAKTGPVKKGSGVAATTPKRKSSAAVSSLPAPSRVTKTAARGTAGATAASRRAGVLGASLGTPAPKRRGAGKK